GRDVTAWKARTSAWLLWTHGPDGRPFTTLPREIACHLEPHLLQLKRRADYRAGPPWQLFRTALAFVPHRVVWADLARRLAAALAARAARALLDLPEVPGDPLPWLTPHQRPAAERLTAVIARHGGAVLADAVGLGKSYVALAVARMLGDPFTLVVPGVLVDQWRALLGRLGFEAPTITHEALSRPSPSAFVRLCPRRLFLVDEARC